MPVYLVDNDPMYIHYLMFYFRLWNLDKIILHQTVDELLAHQYINSDSAVILANSSDPLNDYNKLKNHFPELNKIVFLADDEKYENINQLVGSSVIKKCITCVNALKSFLLF